VADAQWREGKLLAADKLLRETLEAQTRVLGDEAADTLATKATLAHVLINEGHAREAEAMARQAFQSQLRILGPRHTDTLNTLQVLGTALVGNHHYGQARVLLGDIIEQVKKGGEASLPEAWYSFACVAAAANDRQAAIQYLHNAINGGFKDFAHMRVDPDLKSLHGDQQFETLLENSQKQPVAPDSASVDPVK
jgi:hypothetical protein